MPASTSADKIALSNVEALAAVKQRISEDYRRGAIQLPSLPEVAHKVRHALGLGHHSSAQLARIVQLDPALTTRLVQVANSARYHGGRKVETCRDAITRLGIPATRNLATSLVMHQSFIKADPAVKAYAQEVWRESCRVGAIAQVLAHITPGLQADRAMLGGLIHNVGVLPLLPYLADYPQLFKQPEGLEEVISRWRAQLGTQLLKRWQFDESLLAIPAEADNWARDTGGPIDYVDLVLVARAHYLLVAHKGGMTLQQLRAMPAFNKLPIARFGPDASIQVLEEANDEISFLMQLLRNE